MSAILPLTGVIRWRGQCLDQTFLSWLVSVAEVVHSLFGLPITKQMAFAGLLGSPFVPNLFLEPHHYNSTTITLL